MKKNNAEILNKVRNIVNEKKIKKPNNNSHTHHTNEAVEGLNSWIEDNAEKIAKEIIREEVKKIFK